MIKYPVIRAVYDRRKNASSTSKGTVEIEIYYDRTRRFISTGIRIYPHQWSGSSVQNCADSFELNRQLNESLLAVQSKVSDITRSSGQFSFEAYDNARQREATTFLAFATRRCAERQDIGRSTRNNYASFLRTLESFGRIVEFSDLTKENIYAFDAWLRVTGHRRTRQSSSVFYIHSQMRYFIHAAMDMGYMDKDPYMGMRFEKGKARTMCYLTADEIQLFKSVELKSACQRRDRDVFLVMCYTGLAYSDIKKFDFRRDVYQRDGVYMFDDRRVKTDEDYHIVLIKQAVEILRRNDFDLHVHTLGAFNRNLRNIAARAGIRKEVTSHCARHTAAMMALNNKIPLETVSRMLGHSNTRTTSIYAHLLTEEVDKAYKQMEDIWE